MEVATRVLFGKFHVLVAEPAWFPASRVDAGIALLLQRDNAAGTAAARGKCTGVFQTGD